MDAAQIKILIVEDEALYANSIEIIIDNLGYEHLATVADAGSALKKIEDHSPDLLLVDINLEGEMNGIEMVKLAQRLHPTPAIFITSFADQHSFEQAKALNPYAYITKPFDAEQLQRAIELSVMRISATQSDPPPLQDEPWSDLVFHNQLFIKVRSQIIKLVVDDIDYLEVEDRYCTIVSGEQKYVARVGLNEMSKKLPPGKFYRVHRKYIVNLEKISSIDVAMNLVHLSQVELPISRSSKEILLQRLNWIT